MRLIARLASAVLALSLALTMPAWAADISASTWSETDGSNNSASPNGWKSGVMLPSQVEPTARAMMGAVKRFYNHVNPTVTSGGAANAQTLTYSVAPTAYVAGDSYTFKVGFTNTGAATLNVNNLGATAVQNGGNALIGNELNAGDYVSVVYDGTNFQLVTRQVSQIVNPGPSWASYSGRYDPVRIAINSYPTSAEFGGSFATTQAGVFAVDTPATDPVTTIANIGVSGYCRTAGKQCVGVGGFATQTANISNSVSGIWGSNTLVSNSPTLYPSGNVGFDFQNAFGLEVDFNIVPKSGAATPTGNVNGIALAGGSTVAPTGNSTGLQIGALGTGIPWTYGYWTGDGAVSTGISLGASGTGNGVGSQQIQFRTRTGGGTNQTEQVIADSLGNIVVNAASGGSVVAEVNSIIAFVASAGAGTPVNYVVTTSSSTTNPVIITAGGSDSVINLQLQGKGGGSVFPSGPFYLGSVTGAGASSKTVCVDSNNFVLLKAGAC